MKAIAIVTFSVLALLYAANNAEASASCNGLSTAKIVGKLCFDGDNKRNQTLIDGFYGCYDEAPGKEQFVKCQTDAFGGPINSIEAVDKTCWKLYKVPSYSSCLKTEFKNADLDMDAIVKQINDCQSKVMGVGPSLIPGCRD